MEAAGFASAIITFIEFSYKLVNGSITAYESGSGLIDEDVSRVVNDLETATKAIDVASNETSSGPHWAELRELAVGCNALSNDLIRIIEKTRRRQDGNRALRSFGAAWASLRSSRDVMEIQRKLNEYRAQILVRLGLILDGRQQWIAKQLEELQAGNARYFKETVTEFESLQKTIKELKSRLSKQVLDDQRVYDPRQDHSHSLAEIYAELSRISSAFSNSALKTAATDVLGRLYFETMHSRIDRIGHGEFQFFSWLFSDDQEVGESAAKEVDRITEEARDGARHSITQWLEVGDKVLHISGKAGSGKSVLMKRLSHDTALQRRLEEWSGDKKLVLASFFFWGTGDRQQTSLEGLYRSLLYELLMKYPDLTIVAFPGAVHHSHSSTIVPFRLAELCQALTNLIETDNDLADHRFCFFIDGLDEYQGDEADHVDLARQLSRWAGLSNVKICASSRPHPEFHTIFDKAARMHLHELTGADIHRHAYEAFQSCPGVQLDLAQLDNIADHIVWKAEGVFLWARFAITALLGHAQYAVTEHEVITELKQLPSNLDSLFLRLFGSISSSERTRAYQLLLIVKASGYEPKAIALSWIDDLEDADFPFNRPRLSCSDKEALQRVARVEIKLKLLCKGLVELRRTGCTSQYFKYNVVFMHRSILDFLNHPDTISSMKQHLGASFQPKQDIQRLNFAALKFSQWDLKYFDRKFAGIPENMALWNLFHEILRGGPAHLNELDNILDCCRSEVAIMARPEQSEYSHFLRKETPNRGSLFWGQLTHIHPSNLHTSRHSDMDVSFPHCLATYGHVEALVERVKQHGSGYYEKKGLCLILSAFMCGESARMIQALLDIGVHISDDINLWITRDPKMRKGSISIVCVDGGHRSGSVNQHAPFWVAVVLTLVCWECNRQPRSIQLAYRYYRGLEVLLRAGVAPTADIWIEFDDQGKPIFFSFEEFIIRSQPPNSDILIRELRRLTWRGWAGQWMSRAASLWPLRTSATPFPAQATASESEAQRAACFQYYEADAPSLRRIWMGADKYEVSYEAEVQVT